MDPTKFDTKMAELRAEEIKKANPVGRPKGPEKVVYKRSVSAAMVGRLDELLRVVESGDSKPSAPVHHGDQVGVILSGQTALDELKNQLAMVLDDNEKLTIENKGLEGKLQRVARLTDNEKLILWIRKYDLLKQEYDKKVGASEFSQ